MSSALFFPPGRGAPSASLSGLRAGPPPPALNRRGAPRSPLLSAGHDLKVVPALRNAPGFATLRQSGVPPTAGVFYRLPRALPQKAACPLRGQGWGLTRRRDRADMPPERVVTPAPRPRRRFAPPLRLFGAGLLPLAVAVVRSVSKKNRLHYGMPAPDPRGTRFFLDTPTRPTTTGKN